MARRRRPALHWLAAIACGYLWAAPPVLAGPAQAPPDTGPALRASRLQAQPPALSDGRFRVRAQLTPAPVTPSRDATGQLVLHTAVTAKGGDTCDPLSGIFRDGFEDP
jgi:hypothetical protein